MTIEEILEEGREAARVRDLESPLSAHAAREVAIDLGIEFAAMQVDDLDSIRHGLEEDPKRVDDVEWWGRGQ